MCTARAPAFRRFGSPANEFSAKRSYPMTDAPQDAPHPSYTVRPATVADAEERAA